MNTNIITYLACICFIFIFGRIFILPLKKILKLVFNSILGGICIFVINLVGANFGFHIGLNFFTSIVIRIVGTTWSGLPSCCEIIDRIKRKIGKQKKLLAVWLLLIAFLIILLFNCNRLSQISWFIHI